ncbi:hypothetical protein SAMN05421595_1315 [Austwickia chelonae]|uniref:Uncharacterized protein n=1 Tax=Austwickia chelonae NBRC 105200 TaxID=1184607 RepID=K6VL96_9MICO|nr:hypothetical protein [Austwickia chelonae]GAB77479.1 hypothetical protein AUCHE_05_03910 [Austwickia chelonae NBRC 105200]SEW11232.1 hypothetical protein SAMN05421595_1315 [Austwickia chelonae]
MDFVSHQNSWGMSVFSLLFALALLGNAYWERSSPDRNRWYDENDPYNSLFTWGYLGPPLGGMFFLGAFTMLLENVFQFKVKNLPVVHTPFKIIIVLSLFLVTAILLGYRGQWLMPRWARPLEKDRLARVRAERRYRLAKLWARLTDRPAPPPPAIRDIPPPRSVSKTRRSPRKVEQQDRRAAPRRTGPRSATIRITRPRRFGNAMLRKCVIQVDGDDAAAIRLGGTADIAVTAGYHSVRVLLDWTCSPCCEVDVPAGGTATLMVMSTPVTASGRHDPDGHYLELHHDTTAPTHSKAHS